MLSMTKNETPIGSKFNVWFDRSLFENNVMARRGLEPHILPNKARRCYLLHQHADGSGPSWLPLRLYMNGCSPELRPRSGELVFPRVHRVSTYASKHPVFYIYLLSHFSSRRKRKRHSVLMGSWRYLH